MNRFSVTSGDPDMYGELLDLLSGPAWMDDAACKGMDINVFYPERGEDVQAARKVCAGCRVQAECLEYALTHNTSDDYGVWGDSTARARRGMRQARSRAQRSANQGTLANCGTDAGYYSHRFRGQQACDRCRAAHAAAEVARQKRDGYRAGSARKRARYAAGRADGLCSGCAGDKHGRCTGCTCLRCGPLENAG